jgi:hypothetical protein
LIPQFFIYDIEPGDKCRGVGHTLVAQAVAGVLFNECFS